MNKNATIVITGAAGFIGSCLVSFLNRKGFEKILLVDDFTHDTKKANYESKKFIKTIERNYFFQWLHENKPAVAAVFHIGARTDTTEFNYSIHQQLNVEYSQKIWHYCTIHEIPLIYASSAATYGKGEFGYEDDHNIIYKLHPLNPYGISKNEFDKWVLHQDNYPPFWAGLKFFNVYGPNEYHKGRMASVIWHAFNQIRKDGYVKLFKSHKQEFKDGEQLRDFIYVKDVLEVCWWLMENKPASGLYNLGTGIARTFNDLVTATFTGLDKKPDIRYIDMPRDIRETYQYYTEANMSKLKSIGYSTSFYSLEEGIAEYVKEFLIPFRYY